VGLAMGVMAGGVVRMARAGLNPEERGEDPGVLYSSGLIAGEALIGIAIALMASFGLASVFPTGLLGFFEIPATIILYLALVGSLWMLSKPRAA